jgi:hypothetical protein
VRFDPLPPERIAAALVAEGVTPELAEASARLSLGSAARARELASEEGGELRAEVNRLVQAALDAGAAGAAEGAEEPWRALLERAEERRGRAEEEVARRAVERLELEPKGRERKALEREFEEAAKREGRRARTQVLDLGLELAALGFRDLVCVAEGAPEAVLATDRRDDLAAAAHGRDPRRLREAAERCEDVRSALELNVTEELALSALSFRLARLVAR